MKIIIILILLFTFVISENIEVKTINNWNKIKMGMKIDMIINILGLPDYKQEYSIFYEKQWRYGWYIKSGFFRAKYIHTISVDKNGAVIKIFGPSSQPPPIPR